MSFVPCFSSAQWRLLELRRFFSQVTALCCDRQPISANRLRVLADTRSHKQLCPKRLAERASSVPFAQSSWSILYCLCLKACSNSLSWRYEWWVTLMSACHHVCHCALIPLQATYFIFYLTVSHRALEWRQILITLNIFALGRIILAHPLSYDIMYFFMDNQPPTRRQENLSLNCWDPPELIDQGHKY